MAQTHYQLTATAHITLPSTDNGHLTSSLMCKPLPVVPCTVSWSPTLCIFIFFEIALLLPGKWRRLPYDHCSVQAPGGTTRDDSGPGTQGGHEGHLPGWVVGWGSRWAGRGQWEGGHGVGWRPQMRVGSPAGRRGSCCGCCRCLAGGGGTHVLRSGYCDGSWGLTLMYVHC